MPTATVNGATLHYEEHGSGPPLLLVNGTGAYGDVWSPIVDGLASAFRTIVYDRRGFGRSMSAPPASIAEQVRDAAELLEHLDASPATIVAWSGGGAIGLGLAASHPDRVTRLVLPEPAVHLLTHPTPSALAMLARSARERYLRRDPAEAAVTMHRWATGWRTGGNCFDQFPAEWQAQMRRHAPTTVREMDRMTWPFPSRQAIGSIRCPVTIIEGDLSDPSFHAADRFVLRVLPQARKVMLPGAGHVLHVDQPDAWVAAVLDAAEASTPATAGSAARA